jgi:hypothetical protein
VVIDVSLTVSPVCSRDGSIIGAAAIARDVTGERENHRRIEQNLARLALLHSIDRAILAAEGPRSVGSRVLPKVRDLTAADRASLMTFDTEAGLATYLATDPDGMAGYSAGDSLPLDAVTALMSPGESLSLTGSRITRADEGHGAVSRERPHPGGAGTASRG